MNRSPRHGVTMIELLVVISVLLTVVVTLTAVLSSGDKTVSEGGQRADTETAAQCAIDMLSRDLRQCAVDNERPFSIEDGGTPSYDFTNSVLRFFTLDTDASGAAREFHAVSYRVTAPVNDWGQSYALTRAAAGRDTPTPGRVAAFRVAVPDGGDLARVASLESAPAFVDIYLELLDEADARQSSAMTDVEQRNAFVDSRARRYTYRAFTMGREP